MAGDKLMAKQLYLFIILIIFFGMNFAFAAGIGEEIQVSECQEIKEPGFYKLAGDLESNGTCISIKNDSVTFDGNGHTISGDGTGFDYAVKAEKGKELTIMNLNAEGFDAGILVKEFDDVKILNVQSRNNLDGIRIEYTNNSYLERVNATENNNTGIMLYSGSKGKLIDNFASGNKGYGIRLKSQNDMEIEHNEALFNENIGIYLHLNSSGNVIKGNQARNNKFYGVRAEFSPGTSVSLNEIWNNDGDGLIFIYSPGSLARGNVLDGNKNGLKAENSKNLEVYKNTIQNNNESAIYLYGSENSSIKENLILNNGKHGVYMERVSGSEIRGNEADANGENGISLYLSENNILSGNRLNDNFKNGLYMERSSNNMLENISVGKSREHGVLLNVESMNNSFKGLKVRETSEGYDDFKITTAGLNGTSIEDADFDRYTLIWSIVKIKSIEGEISFLEAVDGSGKNFEDDFSIVNNFAVLNSSQSGFANKSAVITLLNLPENRINHFISKNGAKCPAEECRNLTSINGKNATFEIKSLGRYSISSESAPIPVAIALPASTGSSSSGGSSQPNAASKQPEGNISFEGFSNFSTLDLNNSGKIELKSPVESQESTAVTGAVIGSGYKTWLISGAALICIVAGLSAALWYKKMNGEFW